jgi:hypothetical protein
MQRNPYIEVSDTTKAAYGLTVHHKKVLRQPGKSAISHPVEAREKGKVKSVKPKFFKILFS